MFVLTFNFYNGVECDAQNSYHLAQEWKMRGRDQLAPIHALTGFRSKKKSDAHHENVSCIYVSTSF